MHPRETYAYAHYHVVHASVHKNDEGTNQICWFPAEHTDCHTPDNISYLNKTEAYHLGDILLNKINVGWIALFIINFQVDCIGLFLQQNKTKLKWHHINRVSNKNLSNIINIIRFTMHNLSRESDPLKLKSSELII